MHTSSHVKCRIEILLIGSNWVAATPKDYPKGDVPCLKKSLKLLKLIRQPLRKVRSPVNLSKSNIKIIACQRGITSEQLINPCLVLLQGYGGEGFDIYKGWRIPQVLRLHLIQNCMHILRGLGGGLAQRHVTDARVRTGSA